MSQISNLQWTGHGYTGAFNDPGYIDASFRSSEDYASGILYGFHTDVGRNLWDYRSFTGTFGSGSLQVVMDRTTGQFHIDVDQFNPYQDVVNFVGHAFVEVLPNLFRKIFE